MTIGEHTQDLYLFVKQDRWADLHKLNIYELFGFYICGFISKNKLIQCLNNKKAQLNEKEFDTLFKQIKKVIKDKIKKED